MATIDIRTKLGCNPKFNSYNYISRQYITRGATAIFKVNFDTKFYSLEDIYQLSFLFKQNNTILKFDAFEDVEIESKNPGEYIEIAKDKSYIALLLPPEVTVKFTPTGYEDDDEYDLVDYEIIIQLDPTIEGIPDSKDPVIIEKQIALGVKDSVFAYYADQTICSETTLCSEDTLVKN